MRASVVSSPSAASPNGDVSDGHGGWCDVENVQHHPGQLPRVEPVVALPDGLGCDLFGDDIWGAQAKHGVDVNKLRLTLSDAFFQVGNDSGDFRPLSGHADQ